MLVDVLRGSQSNKILSDHLDQLNGYGKLAKIERDDVQYLVEWLVQNGFILKTKGQYPVLHPTYNGEHYGEIISRQKLQALKNKLQK
jgi:DNA helicase-4